MTSREDQFGGKLRKLEELLQEGWQEPDGSGRPSCEFLRTCHDLKDVVSTTIEHGAFDMISEALGALEKHEEVCLAALNSALVVEVCDTGYCTDPLCSEEEVEEVIADWYVEGSWDDGGVLNEAGEHARSVVDGPEFSPGEDPGRVEDELRGYADRIVRSVMRQVGAQPHEHGDYALYVRKVPVDRLHRRSGRRVQ